MEVGRIPDIDNAKVQHVEKISKVKETDNQTKVVSDEQYKNASSKAVDHLNEVIVDNMKFGFNRETKDFYIKVTRGAAENKFPTEDMMKMKAYMNELSKETAK